MSKKVLGVGNALIDVLIPLEDESFFKEFNLSKGASNLVDRKTYQSILEQVKNDIIKKESGGSAANTIHGLSRMGLKTGFIGKVGRDAFGDFIIDEMKEQGMVPFLLRGETETGAAITFITPDSERTFAVFLGSAIELTDADLQPDFFKGFDYFHMEGYLVQNHPMMLRALQLAKKAGLTTSLDLASYTMVEENYDFLHNLVQQYVDIVFANEEEAKAYTGITPRSALDAIAEECKIAVVKVGKEGSWIKRGNETAFVPPKKIKAVDTTGAGDLYASGMLFGLASNYSIEKSGKIATELAGTIIQHVGARIPSEDWITLKRKINGADF